MKSSTMGIGLRSGSMPATSGFCGVGSVWGRNDTLSVWLPQRWLLREEKIEACLKAASEDKHHGNLDDVGRGLCSFPQREWRQVVRDMHRLRPHGTRSTCKTVH